MEQKQNTQKTAKVRGKKVPVKNWEAKIFFTGEKITKRENG